MPYTYSPPNWLYQKGSETRPRTANGNTLSTGTASFTYDGFNRLASSQTAAETTTYTYNALGERMKKINQNGLSTVFHYGPDGELLWEKDQAGNTKVYVWLDGRPLARIDNDAQIYYYHVDRLGTPQAMTNSAGTVVWTAVYEPFGKAAVTTSTVENNLRFIGQYFDRETGLHYNYFRNYDPTTGRYVESDPIGLAGGINTYAYALSNPLKYTDPLGLDAEMCYRPIQGYIIPGQHCFMRFNGDNNDTSSFDPNGVHPDPTPKGASCEATKGPQDDDCVKREMKKCQNYDFIKNNCCHCAEQAMKACGQSIPVKNWPNWPINPGPQPGEPGYKP